MSRPLDVAPEYEAEQKPETAAPAKSEAEWPTLDEAALHGLVGEIVATIDPHTEADRAAVLVHLLVMFGNAIGRTPYVQVGAHQHFGNLFAVIVGISSKGRKGTSEGQARRLFRFADTIWESTKVQGGLSSGEGLMYAVRDPIEKEEKVKLEDGSTGYETAVVDKGVEDKRLLAIEPEFSAVLKVMAREGSILSTTIRQAWDSGELRVLNKNTPLKATGAHISVVGHSTADDLTKYLDATDACNGLGNRFLWVCAKRSKVLPEGGQLTDADLSPLAKRLETAIDTARRCGEVRRDADATRLWHAVYEDLSRGGTGLAGALTSRAEAQAVRLSLLYAMLDCSRQIRKEHLEAALALWSYCDQSVRYIFGDAIGDANADKILAALRRTTDGMSRSEISGLFSRHLKPADIDRAVALLDRLGKITSITVDTGGRRETRYFAK